MARALSAGQGDLLSPSPDGSYGLRVDIEKSDDEIGSDSGG